MTLPFENDTSKVIHGLAKADLKTHKLKTLLTAIIIVLATGLMATVFSILVNDALNQANQAPYHPIYFPTLLATLEDYFELLQK